MVSGLRDRGRHFLRRVRDRAEERPFWLRLLRLARNEIARFLVAIVAAWAVGAAGIHLAEARSNNAFSSWGESFWNVWLLMFGMGNETPVTPLGRLLTVFVIGTGICLVGLFTGSVASIFVENRLRRRQLSNYEMEDHLVLCHWAPRGLEWIQEVHSKVIGDRRPVVIIHDNPEAIDLPDKQDEPAFNDVYIVKGDPSNEVILRRARVPRAHSVVILADDRQGEHADGKSILACIAIRNVCRGKDVNIAVECRTPANRHHLRKAGADEIISSDELGLRLLARASLYHGMTRVYQELLTVGRDANEMYLLRVPPELVGRDFVEASSMFLRYRTDKRSCILIGVQRGEEMVLNPIGSEAGPLQADDELILLSRAFVNLAQAWPTVPPIPPPEQNR